MGFEYKTELKELLTEYMEILEQEGKTENKGDGYWDCPFCGSGTKEYKTAAFHINGVNYKCFSCGKKGDLFDLVAYMEKLTNRDWKAHYNRAVKIAIGLGGVNETDKLVEQLKNKPCNKKLILALDQDKAGKAATGKLIEKLAEGELGNHYIVVSCLYGEYKDANEYLIADKDRFKETLDILVKWIRSNS